MFSVLRTTTIAHLTPKVLSNKETWFGVITNNF